MLDLTKLAKQIPGISMHLRTEAAASRQRLELAHQLLSQTQARQDDLIASSQQWRDRMTFTAATPIEPLDTRIDLNPPPASHTVFATDGSQIAPSHHEIAYCYLINVGRVMLHYGQSLHPLLDSLPEVFYRPEDLYVSRQWGIRTEEWMGYRRTISEISVLAEMACRWVKPPGPHFDIPNLAMVDGSLIYWFLESLPGEARDRILPPILAAWQQLRTVNVPLLGYLSATRGVEALNFLRLEACPHPTPDCQTHCANITDKLPCQVVDPLRDAVLWGSLLQPGQRSPLFRSSVRILDLYNDHRIYFCYVHVGTEVARIEVPEWVVQNSTLFNQALSLMLAQVYKGYGYPVALAEAHNQAVVRGGDRTRFFALLEQQMIRAGLRNVGTSYKEARKRGSIS
ncbi:MAG TPA: nuclease [Cyanobacteria bacterium UBA8803]|nr:nuclease [Cyanobacteria bacterium UBA9273]HBL60355.1 nuclease [Cyanobacteria bacterium UBA8803]